MIKNNTNYNSVWTGGKTNFGTSETDGTLSNLTINSGSSLKLDNNAYINQIQINSYNKF